MDTPEGESQIKNTAIYLSACQSLAKKVENEERIGKTDIFDYLGAYAVFTPKITDYEPDFHTELAEARETLRLSPALKVALERGIRSWNPEGIEEADQIYEALGEKIYSTEQKEIRQKIAPNVQKALIQGLAQFSDES